MCAHLPCLRPLRRSTTRPSYIASGPQCDRLQRIENGRGGSCHMGARCKAVVGVPRLWRSRLNLRQHVARRGHRFYRLRVYQRSILLCHIEFVLQRYREPLRPAEVDCTVSMRRERTSELTDCSPAELSRPDETCGFLAPRYRRPACGLARRLPGVVGASELSIVRASTSLVAFLIGASVGGRLGFALTDASPARPVCRRVEITVHAPGIGAPRRGEHPSPMLVCHVCDAVMPALRRPRAR